MKQIIMCGHTGSYNRGCEAIVRSTTKILNSLLPQIRVKLATTAKADDLIMGIDSIVDTCIEYNPFERYSYSHFKYASFLHILHDIHSAQKIVQRDLFSNIDRDTICLNIGGDTYCYGKPYTAYGLNEHCSRNRVNNVFWGCSVEESAIDEEMMNDLNKYSLIITRESITYKTISDRVKDKDKVKLCADPAFIMDSEIVPLPIDFQNGKMVGINLSPVVMNSGDPEIAITNYDKLMQYILDFTDFNIVLIPHVYSPTNPQDLIPHRALFEKYKTTNRVIIIEEMYNCMQLKYIISQCTLFIGARTHATIAAYSTGVPTLVVGYSVKARGIARDIFGSEENMILPVQSMRDENELVKAFRFLKENEETIRIQLRTVMPAYKEKSWQAGREVLKLLKE